MLAAQGERCRFDNGGGPKWCTIEVDASLLNCKVDRSGRRVDALCVACVALVLLMACAGCGGQATSSRTTPPPAASGWQAEAQQLLHKYGLHATGEPTMTWRNKLRFRPGDMRSILYADVSESIGLDLRAHAGQWARGFWIPVRPETQDGPNAAVFIVVDNEVVGACVMYDATPGIMSLADRPGA